MRRTSTLTAATLIGLAVPAMAVAGPSAAAGETCRGEAATIVGAPGVLITGTEGRDVVVTNQSPRVTTLGGDDLVCITGPDRRYAAGVDIDTGAGDDVVDGTAADSWAATVTLGAGSDRFEGGGADDRVAAGTYAADYVSLVDTDVDVMVGGGGDDTLTSGEDGEPNSDVVHGGEGDDNVRFQGAWTAAATLDGGAGADRLGLALAAGHNTVDNVAGELRHGATPARRWTSFESFPLEDPPAATATVTLVGGPSSEEFSLSGTGAVTADLGDGDDLLSAPSPLPATSSVTGGPGRDTLRIGSRTQDILLDLERGSLQVGDEWTVPATGFENAFAAAPRVELRGTDTANDLYAVSCDVKLNGRNGRDFLGQGGDYAFDEFRACSDHTVMLGGRGHDTFRSRAGADDRMVGGRGNDTFDARGGKDKVFGGPGNDRADLSGGSDIFWGGPGRDKVDGGSGRDLCRAERERRCER